MGECNEKSCFFQENTGDSRIALLIVGQPARMDRKRAMVYVNRKGAAFDGFIRDHGIETFRYGGNETREHLTFQLAKAVLSECAQKVVARI